MSPLPPRARRVVCALIFGLASGSLLGQNEPPQPDIVPPGRQGPAQAQPPAPALTQPSDTPEMMLDIIDFRDLPLGDAVRLFSEQTGLNIALSPASATQSISLYLRNVSALTALDALCRANNLWFRQDQQSGIIRIFTVEEYQSNNDAFRREETTEVFTLLYPNAFDVARTIQAVYGDRVLFNQQSLQGTQNREMMTDLQQRFDLFDLIDGRSQGLGLFSGGGASTAGAAGNNFGGTGIGGAGVGGVGGFGGTGGVTGLGGVNTFGSLQGGLRSDFQRSRNLATQVAEDTQAREDEQERLNLRAEEIQLLESAEALAPGEQSAQLRQQLIDTVRRRLLENADIYMTIIRRHNQVVIRTADQETMAQIRQLICQLDVPTPLVLLEVKVLQLDLDDTFNSVFDYQFSDSTGIAGGFTSGNILPPASDISQQAQLPIAPGGSGLNTSPTSGVPNNFLFQYVNASFRFRMQLLETQNRITELASPILLTANSEVSRVFVGREVPLNRSFTGPAPVAGNINTTGAQQFVGGSSAIEFRPVGTTLLFTPSINADRTVTLRVLQEISRIVDNGATILVPSNTGFVQQTINIVESKTVSGTVVAKDGLTIAIGGLIEETLNDHREEVPVLGKIPILGFMARRQTSIRERHEYVVLIRPYIFNTPVESAGISRRLMEEISIHPSGPDAPGSLNAYAPNEPLRPHPPLNDLQKTFQVHFFRPKDF